MKITGNEPAYPVVNSDGFCTSLENLSGKDAGATGLTIRQQFAMAAMQGLLANSFLSKQYESENQVAKIAVEHADALIAELNLTEE